MAVETFARLATSLRLNGYRNSYRIAGAEWQDEVWVEKIRVSFGTTYAVFTGYSARARMIV